MCTFSMALRVLLADESSTIKKVMQLALQDFGVEVKAVPIGLDVLQVARSFMPDIIFADVLLSKKNGYEVSGELKADSVVKKIPVVLMWSGFMEIDEAKAQASGADRRLEKPFDADTLRSLVKDLCPVLNSNVISDFLTFPEMPAMVEESPDEKTTTQLPDAPPRPLGKASSKTAIPNSIPGKPANRPAEPQFEDLVFEESEVEGIPMIEDMEEPEEFQSVPLPKNQGLPTPPKSKAPAANDDWSRQDLSKYKIELPQDDDYSIDEADLTRTTSIALSSGVPEISLDEIDEPRPGTNTIKLGGKTRGVSKTFGDSPDFGLPPEQGTKSYGGNSSRFNSPPDFNNNSKLGQPSYSSVSALSTLDPMRAEELLRQEARSVMESIAWKIIPEIVERVVREELQKLLKEAERL
jgi:two-component system cell cycle response regulator